MNVVPRDEARPTLAEVYAVARSQIPDALRLLHVPPGDADDILHDIVIAAHNGLERFDPALFHDHDGENDPEAALRAWLAGITWRQTTKYRDRAHRRRELPSGDGANLPMDPAGDGLTAEQTVARRQRLVVLDRLLRSLLPERAEVLIMHDFEGMSVPDIAEELGLNANTVASRISRARKDLQAAVARLPEDERNLLKRGMLFIPLGHDARTDRPGGGLSFAACAPAALAVCAMALFGIGPANAAAPPPIVCVHEVAVADLAAPSTSAPAQMATSPAAPAVAAPPRPARTAAGSTLTARRSMSEELVLLDSAVRTLQDGAHDRALASLVDHRQRFPQGVLARRRDQLEHDVLSDRAKCAAGATSAKTR
jgi:RNA polymerase sigma-70 factor (ECF subfamily)